MPFVPPPMSPAADTGPPFVPLTACWACGGEGLSAANPEFLDLTWAVAWFAAARTGYPIHSLGAKRLAGSGRRYDATTLIDVLEHIPSPRTILADLRGLLRPGGWLAVKVPFGRNQLTKERVKHAVGQPHRSIATNLCHVNHFTPLALRSALTTAGFDRVGITVGVPEFPPFRWSPKVIASRWARAAGYAVARLPDGLRTPLAFNLQVYARAED